MSYYYLDLLVFASFTFDCLFRLYRRLRHPVWLETRKSQRMHADAFGWMESVGIAALITATFYLYAAWRTHLFWLWAVLAAVMLLLGSLIYGSAVITRYNGDPPPRIQPLTTERLDGLIERGKRRIWTRAGVLLLWIASWHHLFLGPGT